jgi:ATP-binding cassette subfamily A (ABC1) protein 3
VSSEATFQLPLGSAH